jgi:hypothetical protein
MLVTAVTVVVVVPVAAGALLLLLLMVLLVVLVVVVVVVFCDRVDGGSDAADGLTTACVPHSSTWTSIRTRAA